jgi:hypothetical protein
MQIPERYVRLCLRVARHLDGFVDAYIGPPDWQRAVDAEPPADPHELRDEALSLADALERADLEPDRRRWLGAQLGAIECALAARLLGTPMAWADEVERCLGVRPQRTPDDAIDAIHARLDAALHGGRSLRDGYNRWDRGNAVPRELIVPALERLRAVLGARAHAIVPLPATEAVDYALVEGVPWIAYNRYAGGYRSVVEVNADLPVSVELLVDLCAHEAYPGHHVERVVKEAGLLRDMGRLETGVVITPAPESVVSEGLALCALEAALGTDPFGTVADVLTDLGLRFDPGEAQAVHEAQLALRATGVNAAFMLHEDGLATADVARYLADRGLESDESAARSIRFLTAPDNRAYVSAYPDGARLCRVFLGAHPDGFARLLSEQLIPADLAR